MKFIQPTSIFCDTCQTYAKFPYTLKQSYFFITLQVNYSKNIIGK